MRWLVLCTLALALTACPASNNEEADAPSGGCTRSSECAAGFVCIAGNCGAKGSVNVGGACWASRDCAGSNYCSLAGRCAAVGAGGPGDGCSSDADCMANFRCDFQGFDNFCVAGGSGDVGDACAAQRDCLPGLFCNAGGNCATYAQSFQPFSGIQCPADSGPFHSYFAVPRGGQPLADFFRLPYPNDARVTASKTLDLTGFPTPGSTVLGVDPVKIYTTALSADFDGFSPMTPVIFRFSADVDLDNGIAPNFHFIDLTANGLDLGGNIGYTSNKTKYACQFYLSAVPGAGVPYAAGHTFAVYITTAARSASGATGMPDPDLVAVLGAARPSDADLARAWDAYMPFRKYLSDHAIAPSTILNAAVFTTADPSVHMARVATAVGAAPPTLSGLVQCGSGAADPCDDGTDARKCGADNADFTEIHGKIALPIFQKGTEPYEQTGGAINETGGAVTKVRDEDVCFAMTVPKGTAPAAGWPLVVYGHGTGGSFRDAIRGGIAGKLAQAKVATFAIDEVGHGARKGTSRKEPSGLVFNVANPDAARGNWLQAGADVLTAVKLPKAATPAGWTGPALKFDKVVYFGHSQGATAGELALPFQDDVKATVLSGAGAYLSASLLEKTKPSDVKAGVTFLLGEEPSFDHPVFLVWQNFFDRVDPANLNGLLVSKPPSGKTAKHVFMSWGQGDHYVPFVANRPSPLAENALTLGLPVVKPVLEDFGGAPIDRPVTANLGGVTGAVFQYAPDGNYDGHFVAQQNAKAVADWSAFIASYFSTGTPKVP